MAAALFEPIDLFEKARTAARLLGEVTAELDGDALDLEGAKTLVDLFTRCERLAGAGRGVAAIRVANGINWKHAGHRNPAEWLASATGTSVGEATRELETARRLEELPATAEAYRNGELSGAQASEIAASATADPEAEAQLLATARDGGSFRAVRDQCREVSMRTSDDAARARRLHDTRSARTYPGSDGHVALHAEFSPDVGASVVSVLEKKTDELFRSARQSGTTELRSAYAADALAALILGDGPRPVTRRAPASRRSCRRTWLRAPRRALSRRRGRARSRSRSRSRCSPTRRSPCCTTTNAATSPTCRHRGARSPRAFAAGSRRPTRSAGEPAATARSASRSTTSSRWPPAA